MTWRAPGLGYFPSPPDSRDQDATLTFLSAAPTPPSVARFDSTTRTLHQGSLPSCVPNAVAQAIRQNELRQLDKALRSGSLPSGYMGAQSLPQLNLIFPFMSRLFAFYFAHKIEKQYTLVGSIIRDVFQAINKLGFPPESEWEYDNDTSLDGRWNRFPSSRAMRAAFDQRKKLDGDNGQPKANMVDYAQIFDVRTSEGKVDKYARQDLIKRTLDGGDMIVHGTQVSDAFCSDPGANNGKPIDPPVNNEPMAGGHAMVWGGYDKDGPDTLNSWGGDYGDAGWLKMSWDYATWEKTGELWIVRRAPLYLWNSEVDGDAGWAAG